MNFISEAIKQCIKLDDALSELKTLDYKNSDKILEECITNASESGHSIFYELNIAKDKLLKGEYKMRIDNLKYYMIGDTFEERKSLILEISNGNILSKDILYINTSNNTIDRLCDVSVDEVFESLKKKDIVLLHETRTD